MSEYFRYSNNITFNNPLYYIINMLITMNRNMLYFTVLVVLFFTVSEMVLFSIHFAIGQTDKSQKYIKPIPLYNSTTQWNPFFAFQFDRHLII